ncbi:murein biosynthesis integral membrane protein MurJ [Cellulomonas fengjieae]|uniref:Murein biosynthesis integral membrane protein MurJ n=1 Tax=Cellulomonas fengjieae TaxID=2819978 RepID=A0ABS3SJ98_9CELL|nr:murein biosynthesis integral membrane protein MurJ [Cellulomonas fengjieae]MBO3085399.1 murein biosynthesis integral membrane protein MurJ [Cellulomonas fengjieae]MBO3101144.1 murein biosynthesis integral membrane protein MurJ [Cellulomonas fengjieae]QVI66049.1 murein biosynthesis integral membrane protein MurJ [Cellulomonas fengjieae]
MTDDGTRRGAALMASGTAVSRGLGLLRGMVMVSAIGATGQAADAFAVANKLPNVLYMLLAGGVLNAILVPQVVRAYKRKVGQEYVDRLLTFGFAALAAVTVVLTLAAPLLVNLYSDFDNPAQQALATAFAYWCIPQLFFYGVYGLLGQVLNARGSFGPYMWAPAVNNLVAIVGFGVFIAVFGVWSRSDVVEASTWTAGQTALLAAAATLGVVAQAVVLIPPLRRAGVRYRPRWGLRGSGLGTAGGVATWTLTGLAIGQLGYVVVSNVASAAPAAAVAEGAAPSAVAGTAAYDVAFLIFMLPHSLVTVSLATALFTRLSGQAHDADVAGVRTTLSSGLRVVGVFTVFATAAIAVLALPLTRVVLATASAGSAEAVATVVLTMILGLPAFGAWSMYQRAYYAYEDARSMVPIQIVMAGIVALGAVLAQAFLRPSLWVAGVGAAMSLSYVAGALIAQWRLRLRLGGVDDARVVRLMVRATLAGLVSAAVGLGVLQLLRLGLSTSFAASLIQCAVVGTVMVLVYGGALRLLRVRELDELLVPVVRRLRRGRR